jgi:hypothetical protein
MAAGKQVLFCYVPLINIAYSGVLQSQLNHAAAEEASGTLSATAQPRSPSLCLSPAAAARRAGRRAERPGGRIRERPGSRPA